MSSSDPIDAIEKGAAHFTAGTIMLEEFSSHFLNVTLETTPDVAAQCLAIAPESSLPAIHCLLKRFSDVDYYYGSEGMGTDSLEEQRRRQPQYRNVGEHLLKLLRGTEIMDFSALNFYKPKS